MGIPKIQKVIGEQFISKLITTSKGEKVIIPRIPGRATKVSILPDGNFEITDLGNKFLGLSEKKTILSEDELVRKYGKYTGKKLQTLG